MRLSFLTFVFFLSVMASQAGAQEVRARVAIVSLIDTSMSHIYGNRWYSSTLKKNAFNYGEKTIEGLRDILGDSNIEIIEVNAPDYLNRYGLTNVFDQPSGKLETWLEDLRKNENADFLILITRKFEPENKISHRYLNGKQYGVGTYSRYPDAISMFSFVGYYIFDTKNHKEISINHNHDQYLLTDLRLNKRMTYHELKDLPQKYIDLTADKMQQIVNTRNVEIKRALLEYLNE